MTIAANRIILGFIFLYASWDKVLEPAEFARVIVNYQILPSGLAAPAALFLPWLELICGICLVINRWTAGSALIVTVLVAVFTAAIGFNIYRGMDVTCGCFTLTQDAPANMWFYLWRDALFLAMGIGALRFARQRGSSEPTRKKETQYRT